MGAVQFWHWWVLGGTLVILEAFVPGFVFLWIGVAAGVIGCVLVVWPNLGLELQLLAFAGLSLASVFGWRHWQISRPIRTDQPNLNRRAAHYVGRRVSLVEPIVNRRGRVKLADATWAVTGPDLPAGRVVEVIAAEGAVLTVEPVAAEAAERPAEISV